MFTAVELIKRFSDSDYRDALESWSWLELAGKSPRFTSLFGDVFFEASDGYWFLDTIEGKLTRPWSGRENVEAALATPDGQEEFLLASLAETAARSGLRLKSDEVYDFKTPPVLGGTKEPDNLAVLEFKVAVNICGQIHDQVRQLPAGASIGAITITPP